MVLRAPVSTAHLRANGAWKRPVPSYSTVAAAAAAALPAIHGVIGDDGQLTQPLTVSESLHTFGSSIGHFVSLLRRVPHGVSE